MARGVVLALVSLVAVSPAVPVAATRLVVRAATTVSTVLGLISFAQE